MSRWEISFVPAKAGTQGHKTRQPSMWLLDSRLRGNERSEGTLP
jgi:hypothetical protein